MSKQNAEQLRDEIKYNILVPFATYRDPIHKAQLLFEDGKIAGDEYGYETTINRIEKIINQEVTSVLESLENIGSVKYDIEAVLSAIQSIKDKYHE